MDVARIRRHTNRFGCVNIALPVGWMEEGEEYGVRENEDAIRFNYIGLGNSPARTVMPHKTGNQFIMSIKSDIDEGEYDIEETEDELIIYKY